MKKRLLTTAALSLSAFAPALALAVSLSHAACGTGERVAGVATPGRPDGVSNGLVRLGRIDSGVEALKRPGPLRVTIELVEK